MKAPGYQNINNIKLMQQNIGCNILDFSDILEDLTSSVTKVKKDEYSVIGKYSIIDQGKEFIAGYYNSNEGISSSGPHIVFGDHTRIFKYVDFPILLGADGTKLLAAKISDVNMKYLYYFFNTLSLPNDGYSRHFKYLKQVIIPLPNIQYQNKIATILDQAQELIDKRKAQIEALDELIQSVFHEMFGDVNSNDKNWNKSEVEKTCKTILGGGTPSTKNKEYFIGDIPWVTPKDMKSLRIRESIININQEAIQNSSAKLIPQGSVLMVIRSGILKRMLPVAINDCEVAVNQDMKAFIPNGEIINAIYLLFYFKSIQGILLSRVRSVTADNLEFNTIKKHLIAIPPIELQNQFAEMVENIEKQKELLNESLVELENNFNSLVQRAFSGGALR